MGRALPLLALLVAMASVQSGASVAKMLFPITGPIGSAALRIGFGTVILCLAGRPWRARLHRDSWLPLAVYGVTLGIMNLLFYEALDRLPIGVAVAVEFMGPLTLAVLSSRRLVDFLWIVIAVCGLALLLPVLHEAQHASVAGLLFALGAGACWGVYIVSGQKVGNLVGSRSVALGSVISAILIVPVGLLAAPPTLFSRAVLLPGLALAVLSTALPFSLEMIALRRLPTRTFSVLMSLEPAVGALSGLLFLGERLGLLQWSAIVLVITASIGATATACETMPAPVPD
ncbi:MAG: EamA family transporter [Steroidobacteraceae bacterium]